MPPEAQRGRQRVCDLVSIGRRNEGGWHARQTHFWSEEGSKKARKVAEGGIYESATTKRGILAMFWIDGMYRDGAVLV